MLNKTHEWLREWRVLGAPGIAYSRRPWSPSPPLMTPLWVLPENPAEPPLGAAFLAAGCTLPTHGTSRKLLGLNTSGRSTQLRMDRGLSISAAASLPVGCDSCEECETASPRVPPRDEVPGAHSGHSEWRHSVSIASSTGSEQGVFHHAGLSVVMPLPTPRPSLL